MEMNDNNKIEGIWLNRDIEQVQGTNTPKPNIGREQVDYTTLESRILKIERILELQTVHTNELETNTEKKMGQLTTLVENINKTTQKNKFNTEQLENKITQLQQELVEDKSLSPVLVEAVHTIHTLVCDKPHSCACLSYEDLDVAVDDGDMEWED